MPAVTGQPAARAGAPTAAAASSAIAASQRAADTLAAQPPVRASGPARIMAAIRCEVCRGDAMKRQAGTVLVKQASLGCLQRRGCMCKHKRVA